MSLVLTETDRQMLEGQHGEAARLAMNIVVRMAGVLEVDELMDVSAAHIDGCGLMSDASLEFAETLARLGGKVRVPTTLNMIPLDLRQWQQQGVPEEFAHKALRMAQAYIDMGCVPTWTCAPYQVGVTPRFGQQVAWGESNAINYANSVLGARTNRYADFFDLCAALTGRVPKSGLHLTENRRGQVLFRLVDIPPELLHDDTFYPVLGHLVGGIAQDRVPVIDGLKAEITSDQFKAFGAAAASSGAVGLYHIVGVTPEAPTLEAAFQGGEPEEVVDVRLPDLRSARADLSTASAEGKKLSAVVLGCPHFSFQEFQQLAGWIEKTGAALHPGVRMVILTNAASFGLLERTPALQTVASFGVEIVFDTCVFHSPLVSVENGIVMTNSGKCAYYGPGELKTGIVFASLQDCVRSAVAGVVQKGEALWG